MGGGRIVQGLGIFVHNKKWAMGVCCANELEPALNKIEYGGYVFIFYQEKRDLFRIKNDIHHCKENQTFSLSSDVKKLISELAFNDMSPFQIIARTRTRSGCPVIYQGVYNV